MKYLVVSLIALLSSTIFASPPNSIRINSREYYLDVAEVTSHAEKRLFSPNLAKEVELYQSRIIPSSRDLRPHMSEVQNQGGRSSCTAFSSVGLVEHYLKKQFGLSEQCLVYLSNNADFGDMFSRIKFIKDHGLYRETDCPYVDPVKYASWPNADEPTKSYLRDVARTTIPNLDGKIATTINAQIISRNVDGMNTQDILDHIHRKIDAGYPVGVASFLVGDGWGTGTIEKVPTDEEIRKACPVNPSADSPKKNCSAHSFIITGYDDARGVFYFKNSWDKDWGVNQRYRSEASAAKRTGYGVMSHAYLAKFIFGKIVTLE